MTYDVRQLRVNLLFGMSSDVIAINSLQNCTLHQIVTVIKSRRIRWTGHVTDMEDMRNAYKILVGKPEGKRPFGRRKLT
jgi:hypothetical protein